MAKCTGTESVVWCGQALQSLWGLVTTAVN